jgi:hypothetical protein
MFVSILRSKIIKKAGEHPNEEVYRTTLNMPLNTLANGRAKSGNTRPIIL